MTTKTLKKFMYKKKAYYTDGGECYDLGSEGDFGHYVPMNFLLYLDADGKVPLTEMDMPDEDGFYGAANRASKSLLFERGTWGYY